MNKFTQILLTLISAVFTAVTPELRQLIEQSIDQWEKKARQTSSPVDDMAVRVIKNLLGLD